MPSPAHGIAGTTSQKSANFQFKRPDSRAQSSGRVINKKDLIDPAKAGNVGKLGNNILLEEPAPKVPQIRQILTARKSFSAKRKSSHLTNLPHLRVEQPFVIDTIAKTISQTNMIPQNFKNTPSNLRQTIGKHNKNNKNSITQNNLKQQLLRDQGVKILNSIIHCKNQNLKRQNQVKQKTKLAFQQIQSNNCDQNNIQRFQCKRQTFPKSKNQAQMMMFKEIFVSPKEQRLYQLKRQTQTPLKKKIKERIQIQKNSKEQKFYLGDEALPQNLLGLRPRENPLDEKKGISLNKAESGKKYSSLLINHSQIKEKISQQQDGIDNEIQAELFNLENNDDNPQKKATQQDGQADDVKSQHNQNQIRVEEHPIYQLILSYFMPNTWQPRSEQLQTPRSIADHYQGDNIAANMSSPKSSKYKKASALSGPQTLPTLNSVRTTEAVLDSPKSCLKSPRMNQIPQKKKTSSRMGISFFIQQIEVQPPQGLNATVAAPLSPGGGWAPSIPINTNTTKLSFTDLKLRARSGIISGDVQKQAHMAFCLGQVQYEKNKLASALKFFKRFFFCARLLDDPVGAALALNKLAVSFHKLGRHQKSLLLHKKHLQCSDSDNSFAALYNIGITYRILGKYAQSLSIFQRAKDWAMQLQEAEPLCMVKGQIAVTYLFCQNFEESINNFLECVQLSSKLDSLKIMLECHISLGYIFSIIDNVQQSKSNFQSAYYICKRIGNRKLSNLCLCNMGINGANQMMMTMLEQQQQRRQQEVQIAQDVLNIQ